MAITVKELWFYPVKSCCGITTTTGLKVGRMGFEYDREWVVVEEPKAQEEDEEEKPAMFVAQRSSDGLGIGIRSMCLVTPQIHQGLLVLNAPKMRQLILPAHGIPRKPMPVQIWKTQTTGIDQGEEAAAWLTTYLSRERPGKYRLVRMSDQGDRKTKQGDEYVGFADAFQHLILSQESLDDLNGRMSRNLPMDRFRPNIVLQGCEPYQEDMMNVIQINGVTFVGHKLCVRCAITTTDQLTAERGKEPLSTLARYRHRKDLGGVVFGRNYNARNAGIISIGDTCEVVAWAQQ